MNDVKMKIVRLTAENFMRLVAVEICPNSNAVIISSKRNGEGKSSVLDAILAAFGGARCIPPKPIREGAEEGFVEVETEHFTITRKFTQKGSYLTITNKDGYKASSPQALLDKIVGDISFDPMEFMEKKPADQRKLLMEICGISFDDIDEKIREIKTKRTLLNEQKKVQEVKAKEAEQYKDVPDEEVSVSELLEQLQSAVKNNASVHTMKAELAGARDEFEREKEKKEEIESRIEALRKELEKLEESLAESNQKCKAHYEKVLALEDKMDGFVEIDEAAIRAKIQAAEEINRKVQRKREMRGYVEALNKTKQEYANLGAEIDRLETERVNRLKTAKFPLDGLSVDNEQVLYKGIPLQQVNEAKRLEICLAISMALNPKLRVVRINGNSLDSDSLRRVCEMAKANDYQVWIEKLDESGKIGIVIEDGQVVAEGNNKTLSEK
ncbi:MAG TPA: AAA family ATPase [Anaerohalosphaeraceae bacterium]|nr:AAA family ATPase [Anaerohalosphaeraceae bacterium]HQI08491.1 AAA family ATPase [Anaerohalosphaeraceae bacterium]HQJ68951.1 AAA family ATPase [Anaerohalosphaeraceae bacterium]